MLKNKPERNYGVVAKYIKEKGYGFIKCEEKDRAYFVHISGVREGMLEVGYIVNFEVGINKKTGREQAVDVRIVDSDKGIN